MAVDQTITHAAAAPAATIPVIDIPEDARTGGRGELLFRIRTEAGTVDAEADGSFIRCRGAADALEAAGLVRKEWLPGAPGCNRTAQTVVFGAGGTSLRFRKGKPITDPFIKIRIYGKKFLVLIPPTAEQEARLDRAHSEWLREREQARNAAQEPVRPVRPVRPLMRDILELCMQMDDEGLNHILAYCRRVVAAQQHPLVPAEPCPVISLADYRRSKAGESIAKH